MDELERKIWRMRKVIHCERPDCLPTTANVAGMEYRPEEYHLGEMEHVERGQVKYSEDGKKAYTADGGVWGIGDKEVYHDEQDVLAVDESKFDVEEIGPAMLEEMQRQFDEAKVKGFPGALHYGTLVTRATIEFNWEPFLMAAQMDPDRFGEICARFGEASLAVIKGWCQTEDLELITVHDDIAATRGPILSPDWLRQYAFPWHKKMFDAVHEAGKKVCYISDGNYLPVLDDVLANGPDGLYIESNAMDPGEFMERCGPGKFFNLKTSSRNTDWGTPEDIRQEMARLRDLHEKFPGIYMYRGGSRKPECVEAWNKYYQEYLVYE